MGKVYEVFGEYVSLRDVGLATLLSTTTSMVFYALARYYADVLGIPAPGIILGLVGACVGFALSILKIKVKRVVVEV